MGHSASRQVEAVHETHALAASLAKESRPGDCLLLHGDLGAGKTEFARGFIAARCGAQEVVSPTFSLVQQYEAPDAAIWHFDLYRLKSAAELQEIGLEEALQSGITLIEWPQLALRLLPGDRLEIVIEAQGDRRVFTFKSDAPRWQPWIESIRA